MQGIVNDRQKLALARDHFRCHRLTPDRLEPLESRQLLAAAGYSFVAPDLSTLAHQANATAAMYNRLVGSLQAQIVLGPLTDLKAIGNATTQKINGNQYAAAVASMVQGFESAAKQQEPGNHRLASLADLQGTALDAATVVLNTKRNDGLESDIPLPGTTSLFYNDNLTTVEHLTLSRPLWTFGTPILNYINRTELFQTDLATASTLIPKLGIATAASLAGVEAASFTADINLSTPERPGLDTFMGQQVATLLTQINNASQSGTAGAPAFAAAVSSFQQATYNSTTGAGYLGPQGDYGRYFVQPTTADQIPKPTTPLPYSTGNTFALGRYRAKKLHQTAVYHRNFGDATNVYGKYVTTALFPNSAVAIRRSALDQTFQGANTAFYVEDVKVPKGHYVFVGRVAPIDQGVLKPRDTLYPGLGSQVVLDNSRAPDIKFTNPRTTGT
jgi:hypothetical protein